MIKKISPMAISLLLMSAISMIAGCSNIPREGKQLFILAGQSNMAMLDPATDFAPAVEKEFGRDNVIIVKDAYADKRINRWHKNWQSPFGDHEANAGDLYEQLMTKVRAALASKHIDHTKIAAITFIWMQGESDARTAYYADAYEQSMYGLYAQLQEDFHRPDIHWVIGRLSDHDMKNRYYKRWTKIRGIQETVAMSNTRFGWVNTDDLNDGVSGQGKTLNNDLHYSEEGYKILGQRFADSAIGLLRKNAD